MRERLDVLRLRDVVALRVVVDFFARDDAGFARDAVEREAAAVLARVVLVFARVPAAFDRELVAGLRVAVLRLAAVLRVPVERDVRAAAPLELELLLGALSAGDHLPDITRCAASATASAIIEPNLVALAIMLLAACEAVSAASSPASRILRRAAGLALIAAAAAARPAASISLLIAALASLSMLALPEVEEDREDVLEEVLRARFAIVFLPASRRKTLYARNGSRMKPGNARNSDMLKGTAAIAAVPFDMVSGRR